MVIAAATGSPKIASTTILYIHIMPAPAGFLVLRALAASRQNLYLSSPPSFVGAIAGAVWGFVDGLAFGILIAWLYNRSISA